ncbi:MAG TPA: T3SS effector HopA1 family protein [Flexivirga sp.]|uniref:T3SS effector HopA1 family protein n=1 Tax=Flexivirga sp. TaxID=1962927 RepID=UPI002CF876A9|nr:T3SS effector HopA1 family protein [Flexivirga sp.]HWC22584.1 T3SS effector HopA1 family protein [Flexivirga sp.]
MMSWDRHTAAELQAAHHVLTVMADADDLATTLYEHWWAAARPGGTSRGRWDPPLGWALRAAHAGALAWPAREHEVLAMGGYGAAVVADPSCRTHRRAVGRGDYLTAGAGAGLAPSIGARLRITRRRGGHDDQGWWRTWGDEWPAGDTPQGLTRVYFAPRRVEVARLVHEITAVVPRITATWSLKVATDPTALDRADAVVLYLPDACRAEAFGALRARCAERVRNSAPPFTEVLTPGMAWSEDPGDGQSFGELRCRWLGEAYRRAEARCTAFADVVAEVFGEHGVDQSSAHLRGVGLAA